VKKKNFKGWPNVFTVVLKRPAQKLGAKAKKTIIKEGRKIIGLSKAAKRTKK